MIRVSPRVRVRSYGLRLGPRACTCPREPPAHDAFMLPRAHVSRRELTLALRP